MRAFKDWELSILCALDGPLPITERPFAALAQQAGVTEEQVLESARAWVEDGTIRRFGARIKHRAVGFTANGMSVWKVADKDIERVAAVMVAQPQVSHCYQRPALPGWEYTLFAMIHGKTPEDVHEVVRRIAAETGVRHYDVLFSSREYKKSTPRYFADLAPKEGHNA